MDICRKHVRKNSLYIAIDIYLLSLNSVGAFRTNIQRRTPHDRKNTSTERIKLYLQIMQTSPSVSFYIV